MITYVYIEDGKVIQQEYTNEDVAKTNIRKQLKFRGHLPTHVLVDGKETLSGEDVMFWILGQINSEGELL